jgi:hypothetical protein
VANYCNVVIGSITAILFLLIAIAMLLNSIMSSCVWCLPILQIINLIGIWGVAIAGFIIGFVLPELFPPI